MRELRRGWYLDFRVDARGRAPRRRALLERNAAPRIAPGRAQVKAARNVLGAVFFCVVFPVVLGHEWWSQPAPVAAPAGGEIVKTRGETRWGRFEG